MREVFRLPDVGEGIAEAEVVEYLVQVGDKVKADQPVIRVETDKAVVELPAPFDGTVAELPCNPGDTVQVGDPLLIIETEAKAGAAAPERKEIPPPKEAEKRPEKPAPKAEAQAAPAPEPGKRVLATPHTRKLARELGVDINNVSGSGRSGRVTDDDIRQAASAAKPAPPKAPTAAAVQAPATTGFDFEKYGPTKREPLKGIRKRTAEVMVRSVSTIPHVTHFDDADVSDLLEVLHKQRPMAEQRGVKLTLLAFVTKAAADALKKYPQFNVSLDEATGDIVYKQYYNIGFATDTEHGLMVPVIRDADKKSIIQIAADLEDLAKRARERSIDLEEMRGGTFTITNVGAIGGRYATPIIVHPEAAILGTARARKTPVVRNNEIVIRTMMPLALSFDHRLLDGADAARFTAYIVSLLSDPMRMLVDVA